MQFQKSDFLVGRMNMKTKVLAIIPARLSSKRFPRKVLYEINGKSLLEHLYREINRAKLIDRVVVATDSDEVIKTVSQFDGEAVKTSKKHQTGSDRTAEVAKKLGGDIIINIQADNLGVKAADCNKVITEMIADKSIKYATFAKRVESEDELYDPNRVKVIFNREKEALWFSRYPLPFLQGESGNRIDKFNYYYHIGIYFYRKEALKNFAASKRTPLEKAESLEQLRILEKGGKIKIFELKRNIWSIDSPDDLKKIGKFL